MFGRTTSSNSSGLVDNHHSQYEKKQPLVNSSQYSVMEPSICLEPFSNTKELFKKPWFNRSLTNLTHHSFHLFPSSISSISSSTTSSSLIVNNQSTRVSSSSSSSIHVGAPSSSSPNVQNNNENNNSTVVDERRELNRQQEEYQMQQEPSLNGSFVLLSNHNKNNNNMKNDCISTNFTTSINTNTNTTTTCNTMESYVENSLSNKRGNGHEDLIGEKLESINNLKRKCVRPISPTKKRRDDQSNQDGENCRLAKCGTDKLAITKSINASIVHVVDGSLIDGSSPTTLQTSTSTDEQMQQMIMLDVSNGTSSVNTQSYTSNSSSSSTSVESPRSFPSSQEDQLQFKIGSEQTNVKNLFEHVEFVTPLRKSNRGRKPKPKKVNVSEGPWTEEEHDLFMLGYQECGKNWSKIADEYVPSRSRTQIASHAQKYFRKQKNKQRR